MNTEGLDGKMYPFKYKGRKRRKRSSHHQYAIDIIKTFCPGLHICEEVPIKIKRGQTQYLDILLPILWVAFEVHGRQHYEYTPHFHNNEKIYFFKGQQKDEQKREWCELNKIILVELAYDRKHEWGDLIKETIRPVP